MRSPEVSMRPVVALALVVLLGSALNGCEFEPDGGGGPGTGPTGGQPTTVDMSSTAALDGWIRSDGNLSTAGAAITGDLDGAAPGLGYRQFYSFDLASLPAGSTVTAATLRLYQAATTGTPYVDLGSVIVDHLIYGDALDAADFSAAPLAANVGAIATDGAVEYKTLSVTARVQADLAAGRTRSQFRVRFSTMDSNNDAGNDFAQFNDAEAAFNPPVLAITYQ
jgi:hypothetical protein